VSTGNRSNVRFSSPATPLRRAFEGWSARCRLASIALTIEISALRSRQESRDLLKTATRLYPAFFSVKSIPLTTGLKSRLQTMTNRSFVIRRPNSKLDYPAFQQFLQTSY
jgi:hypothetical protein